MCSFALMLITGPFFILYASHCYVTTLTMSSGGVDRFVWPKESVSEWFGQGLAVVGVLILWSTLTIPLVGVVVLTTSFEAGVVVWFLCLIVMAPVSLCSVLTAPSPLLFLYPPLIMRMFRQFKAVIYVYVLTLPFLMFFVAGLWLLIVQRNLLGSLVLSIAFPPALLINARAWGRLAWFVLNYDRKPRGKKRKKKRDPEAQKALEVNLEEAGDDNNDDGAYDVKSHDLPTEKQVRLAEVFEEQRAYEERLRRRAGDSNPDPIGDPPIPTFAAALGPQVILYLSYSDPLAAWFRLGLFTLLESGLLLVMLGI